MCVQFTQLQRTGVQVCRRKFLTLCGCARYNTDRAVPPPGCYLPLRGKPGDLRLSFVSVD
eukprot:scaffold98553_cov63-Phaeocystis_antarctica.AAC.2